MRRIGRHRRRKLNRIIVLSAFCLLFVITAGYAAFSTNISLHVKGNILEGTRVIQVWDENSKADFHSDYYKQNILTITFLNNNNVPENAVESWNVSEDKEKGTVKAWVVPNSSDSSKYDLYIGAKGKVIANEDSSNIFYDFRGVKEINFDNNYDTSNATNMTNLFRNCTSLTEIDLSSFDTSNVTNMYAMFCMWDSVLNLTPENKLEHIKFGHNFITDNVTNMRSMFAGLTELKELDLSNFNTKNVTTMYHMFTDCKNLVILDIGNFNTSKVTDMGGMFLGCRSLATLDVSSFDTSKVINMEDMFERCTSLTDLNLSNLDTSNVTNMGGMFNMWYGNENGECLNSNLKELDVSNFNTSKVRNMRDMFACSNVSEIKGLENFNTSNVTDMYHMFANSKNLTELNLCSFDTRKATKMEKMFGASPKLKKVYVGSNWITSQANTSDLFGGCSISSVTTGQCE